MGQSGKFVKISTRKIHYISGLAITLFTGLHLFNHICSIFGADIHITVMNSLRVLYRNFLVEIILLAAVFVQIISGLTLFTASRKTAISTFEKLHIWTGLYLALFLTIHLTAVLSGRFYLHLDTNFYFGVAGLNTFPLSLFFIPYYGLAVISFFGHIAAIHNKKMKQTVFNFTPLQQSKTILVFGFCLTLLILFGLTNRFQGVKIPVEYNVLIGK